MKSRNTSHTFTESEFPTDIPSLFSGLPEEELRLIAGYAVVK